MNIILNNGAVILANAGDDEEYLLAKNLSWLLCRYVKMNGLTQLQACKQSKHNLVLRLDSAQVRGDGADNPDSSSGLSDSICKAIQ